MSPQVDGLFARAATAGYSGVILYDHNLEALGSPLLTPAYVPSLQLVLARAEAHGLEVVLGLGRIVVLYYHSSTLYRIH